MWTSMGGSITFFFWRFSFKIRIKKNYFISIRNLIIKLNLIHFNCIFPLIVFLLFHQMSRYGFNVIKFRYRVRISLWTSMGSITFFLTFCIQNQILIIKKYFSSTLNLMTKLNLIDFNCNFRLMDLSGSKLMHFMKEKNKIKLKIHIKSANKMY